MQKLWFKLKLLIIALDQYYLDCSVTLAVGDAAAVGADPRAQLDTGGGLPGAARVRRQAPPPDRAHADGRRREADDGQAAAGGGPGASIGRAALEEGGVELAQHLAPGSREAAPRPLSHHPAAEDRTSVRAPARGRRTARRSPRTAPPARWRRAR